MNKMKRIKSLNIMNTLLDCRKRKEYKRTITYPDTLHYSKKRKLSVKRYDKNDLYDKILNIQIQNTFRSLEYLHNNIARIKQSVYDNNFDTDYEKKYFCNKLIDYGYNLIKEDEEYLYLQKINYKVLFDLFNSSIYTKNLNYILDLQNYDSNLRKIVINCINKDFKIIKYYKKMNILVFR